LVQSLEKLHKKVASDASARRYQRLRRFRAQLRRPVGVIFSALLASQVYTGKSCNARVLRDEQLNQRIKQQAPNLHRAPAH
jgi:hypothetical protein